MEIDKKQLKRNIPETVWRIYARYANYKMKKGETGSSPYKFFMNALQIDEKRAKILISAAENTNLSNEEMLVLENLERRGQLFPLKRSFLKRYIEGVKREKEKRQNAIKKHYHNIPHSAVEIYIKDIKLRMDENRWDLKEFAEELELDMKTVKKLENEAHHIKLDDDEKHALKKLEDAGHLGSVPEYRRDYEQEIERSERNRQKDIRSGRTRADKGSMCFIATAAYGTTFTEEINVLRIWRDNYLQNHLPGKIFIHTYYKISPPIANLISKKDYLKTITRSILNPFVNFLKKYYKINSKLLKPNHE